MRQLIYKCEPIKRIPLESGFRESDLESWAEWHNYENIGIAVIGTWASWKLPGKRLAAFTNDQLEAFQELVDKAEKIIGFNSLIFDDKLCQLYAIRLETDYDLLREIVGEVISSQLSTEAEYVFKHLNRNIMKQYPIVFEYSLEGLAQANLGKSQSATSSSNSGFWQRKQQQKVIDDCMYQVQLIKKFYDLHQRNRLLDPVYGRAVSRKFPIPVPTTSIYQKLIALSLGALFRPDGNYAYLRRLADYEHYAFLSQH